MKFHITNLYNFNPADELVKKQHRFADTARELGFTEMGIFSYPVETDTYIELSKRLDGVIAALEPEDVVFLQLPTRNGYTYENLLFQKIKAYKNTKIVFILHDLQMVSDNSPQEKEKYIAMFKQADTMIAPASASGILQSYGLTNLLFYDYITSSEQIIIPGKAQFHLKKVFMDAIDLIFSDTFCQMQNEAARRDDIIQIGFGLHDKTGNYSMWVGTAMQSIIEHTESKLCFHILHDKTLTDKNKENLSLIAASNKQYICFHPIDENLFSEIVEQTRGFTIGAMFRTMLPELLPNLSKIIYLDADIMVNRDIKELWDTDIRNHFLAAVPDMGIIRNVGIPVPVKYKQVKATDYFNTGILYLNLTEIKKIGNMKDSVLNYLKENKESLLPDQDALNVLYGKNFLILDETWNYFANYVRKSAEKELYKRVYHFAGTSLQLYASTAMDQTYYETLCRTPWGVEEGPKILRQSIERVMKRNTLLEKILRRVSVSPCRKIFYGPETLAMKNIYYMVSVQEGDIRVLSTPSEESNCILPCSPLSVLESDNKEDLIIFVLPEADNWTSISTLEKMGFVNEKDFFVIPVLLPPEQGGYV